ncbi:MAG: hypothetical protein NXY59_03475 [Aigarchaeota archaeon]|nr:hypothetical protein [Candidatus Pelearchaeum maunauluense]
MEIDEALDKLDDIDFSLMAYPDGSRKPIIERIEKLRIMGVEALYLNADDKGRLSPTLVGKGGRGLVFLCKANGVEHVVKLRRTDASVSSFQHEASMQTHANKLCIGPKLIEWNDDILLMEYIKGENLSSFISIQHPLNKLRQIFGHLLVQCFILDIGGLDHGQLSDASKHVIVTQEGNAVIVDFSHSSIRRKPRNVTQLASYIRLVTSRFGLGFQHKGDLNEVLRKYKHSPSAVTFSKVLEGLDLGATTARSV